MDELTEYDTDKIAETVLALLAMTIHDENEFGCRTWKNHDWSIMNRLHENGYISDPQTKYKSVTMTPDGMQRSRELFERMFRKRDITMG